MGENIGRKMKCAKKLRQNSRKVREDYRKKKGEKKMKENQS